MTSLSPRTPLSWLAALRALRLPPMRMSFVRHQIKRRVSALVRLITDWALFIVVVLAGGLGSSWYMVQEGTSLNTATSGPWVMWTSAARSDTDPYTRAHFADIGALPLNADIAGTYFARSDSDGRPLHSSCDYEVIARPAAATWWSLAVYDSAGRLIPNAADRHAFTSNTAAASPDGRVLTTLARAASPGNWLPTGGAGNLTVVFTSIDLTGEGVSSDPAQLAQRLPAITRGSCR